MVALSINRELCAFHPDVVLQLDPALNPKINSIFHRLEVMFSLPFVPILNTTKK